MTTSNNSSGNRPLRFLIFLTLNLLFFNNNSEGQCTISGLNPTYCIDDASSTLTGSPGGGTFSGPGMTGSTFNPADAGVGVHTITYTIPGDGDKYYLKSNVGNPWGNTSNNTEMDEAFGPGGWTLAEFETLTPATVFSPTTSFVFIEGGDIMAIELNTFLTANLPLIEAWVNAGGSLLLNAAPNEGGDINFGFGGTTLSYPYFSTTVTATDPFHPAFIGPLVPTATTMTGPYYGHGLIIGTGYTSILEDAGNVVLCEKSWGAGQVMVGGMTTANFHLPSPEATNFRANLFTYLNDLSAAVSCIETQDVEVFDLPTVTASVDDPSICAGESVTFTGGGADTYTWDLGVTDGVAFTPGGTGTITYTVTGTNTTTTCQNTATIDLIVNPNPTVTANADFTEICLGDAVIFTGSGADTYAWDMGVTDGVAFTPAAIGTVTYTVTGTNTSTGCQNTDAIAVTVNDNPVVTATAIPDEICLGESIVFTGSGADTYVWDGGITDGVAFTPIAAGTFTYNVTGTLGASSCNNTASVTITVNDLPVVTAAVDNDEICEGESVTFTGAGADSYSWDMGVTDGVAFTPVGAGIVTYTVTGTNLTTTCQNTATVDVNVNPNPSVTASVDFTEICLGNPVVFSGGGADTYTWDMGVTDGVPYTPAAAGTATYTVIGTTTATGCQNTASIDLTVYDNPVVTATATPDEICLGESIVFTGGGADTYVWDGGVTDGVPFTPATVGSFTFNVNGIVSASGCENTSSVTITVNDLPTVTATVDDDEICQGESVIFNGGGATTYTWDMGVTNGIAFTPPSPGTATYTVSGTDVNGCVNTASVDLTVNALPATTASATDTEICLGESLTLTGSGASTYVWSGGIVNGVPFTPGSAGTFTYTVTGTSIDGCSSDASLTIAVIECEEVIAAFDAENSICLGDCITFTDQSVGTIVSYNWDFGGASDPLTSTLQNPTVCFNTLGTYTVELTITNINGITKTITSTIIVNAYPTLTATRDTIIDIGGDAELIATSSGIGAYTWSPDKDINCADCAITTASPEDSVTYTVTFVDQNGCEASAQVMVLVNFVEALGVPTAFSPNGDGMNDVLFVKGYGIETLQFVIYNRYGEVVFSSNDQNIGWDGTFKNKDENPGVFTWVVSYNLTTGKRGKISGNTSLIR